MERRSGYTWPELVAVVVVLAVLVALGLPALQIAREKSRRIACNNNLKAIGLAVHNYATSYKVFPPGTICATGPVLPQNQYDVWAEAGQTGQGYHGTSFLLRVSSYLPPPSPAANVYQGWDFSGGVGLNAGVQGTPGTATTDIPEFYCPTRRSGLRRGDRALLPDSWWPGGGTDYGGCVGRHIGFTADHRTHIGDRATSRLSVVYVPGFSILNVAYQIAGETAGDTTCTPDKGWGIFGRVNVSTSFSQLRDGTSNTIMTGELQRIVVADVKHGGGDNLSHDGWAVGGDATGFTTGYGGPAVPINGQPTTLMNNGFFQSPGSDHVGGANFGIGDGSVRLISTSVDPNVFVLLGSMADKVSLSCGED